MDIIYAESLVVACLQEALRDLTKDTFITRVVADRIFNLGCSTLSKILSLEASTYPCISVTGHLVMYRFRKNIWTLYIENGIFDVWHPSSYMSLPLAGSTYCIPFRKPIKIIAVDMKLWPGK